MDFIASKNFTKALAPRAITLVVIHTAECGERPGAARNVARYFAGATAPQASAHYVVDSLETVQCVHEADVAWHAGPVNACSIGIEHAGRAEQLPEQWADGYSLAVLARSASLVAALCYRYGVPVGRLTADDLRMGRRSGICGHVDVTRGLAYGTHWDPGPNFPWDRYLDLVRAELERIRASEAPTPPTPSSLAPEPSDGVPPTPELPVREPDGGASRWAATLDAVPRPGPGR